MVVFVAFVVVAIVGELATARYAFAFFFYSLSSNLIVVFLLIIFHLLRFKLVFARALHCHLILLGGTELLLEACNRNIACGYLRFRCPSTASATILRLLGSCLDLLEFFNRCISLSLCCLNLARKIKRR